MTDFITLLQFLLVMSAITLGGFFLIRQTSRDPAAALLAPPAILVAGALLLWAMPAMSQEDPQNPAPPRNDRCSTTVETTSKRIETKHWDGSTTARQIDTRDVLVTCDGVQA